MFKKNWRRLKFSDKFVIITILISFVLYVVLFIVTCISNASTAQATVASTTPKQIMTLSCDAPPVTDTAVTMTPPAYSNEELEMVAKVIAAEVGNSSYECQLATAQVIYDRLHHSNKVLYGGYSISDVINWPNQFDSAQAYKNKDLSLYPTALQAATDVFINGVRQYNEATVIVFRPGTSGQANVRTLREYNYIGTIDGNEFRGDLLG